MPGFRYSKSEVGNSCDQMVADNQLAASLTVADGDALVVSNGELAKATSSTTQVDFICQEAKTSGSTDIVKPLCVPARRNARFNIDITPLHNEVAAISGSTTTVVIAQSGYGSGNELQYGTVFIKELGAQRVISTSSATSGGNITITVAEPFPSAPSAGMKVSTLPFGRGGDPKLSDENALSAALADKTGGPVVVRDINLKAKRVEVVFK